MEEDREDRGSEDYPTAESGEDSFPAGAGNLGEKDEEFLRLKRELILKLIYKGLSEHDGFSLLDAENHLASMGPIEPSDQVARIVLENLCGPAHAQDFDLIRIAGYLKNDRIRTVLEDHFKNLKGIWRELDELRYIESNRFVLDNVLLRARDLSALRVVADRFVKTLDDFFSVHFNRKKLERFSELSSVYEELHDLRSSGRLNKGNIESVLKGAVDRVAGIVERKLEELKNRKGGEKIRPNRIIAVYYCLLEALILQRSPIIKIDEEFIEKVAQDFRASHGDGTKRYVLNALLKLEHRSFGSIAAESAYSIKARTIEKMERREAGETAFRSQKVSLGEMQNFDLYETAAEVIARSPSDEVFDFLLLSFSPGALLLGLRSLEKSSLPPSVKLRHLNLLLERGTMDEYVFTRTIQNLAALEGPGAAALLGKLLTERFGWRKTKMPPAALEMIQEGIYRLGGGAVTALAKTFGAGDRPPDEDVPINLPYDETVYDSALGRFVNHFKRNIFHGVSELAQHRLARGMICVGFRPRFGFAERGRKSALSLVSKLCNVSDARLNAMIEELGVVISRAELRLRSLAGKEKNSLMELVVEIRGARGIMQKARMQRSEEERELRGLVKVLRSIYLSENAGRLEEVQLERSLRSVHSQGAARMRLRDRNLREGARRSGKLDPAMLSVRYPASSKTIIEAAPLLYRHMLKADDELTHQVFESLAVDLLKEPPKLEQVPRAREDVLRIWDELRNSLSIKPSPDVAPEIAEKVAVVTAGAAAHGEETILNDMQAFIYDIAQPPSIRLAHITGLPIVPAYAKRWSTYIGWEDETVFLALKLYLGGRAKAKLKEIVPDLLDLLD
jgi:hypothetical protein